MLRNKKKGFTLIELVIVIAIIGILVAIAVPRFASASQTAFNRSLESNARTIAGAVTQHYAQKLKWPGDTEKAALLTSAGVKTADQGKWAYATDAASNKITVKYTLQTDEKYSGDLDTSATEVTSGDVTFEF